LPWIEAQPANWEVFSDEEDDLERLRRSWRLFRASPYFRVFCMVAGFREVLMPWAKWLEGTHLPGVFRFFLQKIANDWVLPDDV
jgi:hypothetical protein